MNALPSITGNTRLYAIVGDPIEQVRSPEVYCHELARAGIDAVLVPVHIAAGDVRAVLPALLKLRNLDGVLVTAPFKADALAIADAVHPRARRAGAVNALRREADGQWFGDMFDGEGFVRGLARKARKVAGASAFVAGCGGVGSAIAASLAKAGVARLGLHDAFPASMNALAERLKSHYPKLEVVTGSADPAGYAIVVNATPLGMKKDDPLPIDVDRISPSAFVGEVVMKEEITPFLAAARGKGCDYQVGTDMLFEQIPAYLEFFGLGTTTADELRSLARIHY